MPDAFAVDGVDHVELYVSDWDEAAEWYQQVLGLDVDDAFEQWWETGVGPLVLTPAGGGTKLALFERDSSTTGEGVSPHRVAFQTDGDAFLAFLERLEALEVTDSDGEPVGRTDAIDHDLSYSVYFSDPDGNLLEVTTYDRDIVADRLG